MTTTGTMKKLSIFITLCLAAAGVAYLAAARGGAIAEMTVRSLGGVVTLERDGESSRVEGDVSLEPGDVIVTAEGGSATLALADERRAWLQSATEIMVVNDSSIEGHSGSLRAKASGDEMMVMFDGIEATTEDGHFRVDQGFGSARAATYSGDVRLTKPGEPRLSVTSLFEVEVAAADLPRTVRPYRFDVGDPWDAEILDDVIALDEDLTQLGRGLSSQLGKQKPKLGYFNSLAGKRVVFMKPYLKRSTEDLLIGFTVADNSASRSMPNAFVDAMNYRDDGGRWGVVASILEAEAKVLVADLKGVIVATGAGGNSSSSPSGGDQPVFLASGGGSAPPGTSGSADDPEGPGGKDPKGGNPDDPPRDCQEGVECDLQDLEDELPDLSPSPDPSEPPDEGDSKDPPITSGMLGGGQN